MKQAVGYRVWRPDGGKLLSPFFPTMWPQSTRLEAVCLDEPASFLPGHRPVAHQQEPTAPPPVANCGCGIYAYHDVARMLGAIHPPLVGGAVLCWGRITIHPEGIRAQFARPIALCFPEPWLRADRTQSPLTGVAAGYRIPLLESSYLVSYAGEFGESYLPAKVPATSAWFGTAPRRFLSWLTGV